MEILDAAGFEIQQICEKTSTERLGISRSIESAVLLIRTMYIYIYKTYAYSFTRKTIAIFYFNYTIVLRG